VHYTSDSGAESAVEVRRLNQNGAATWQQPDTLGTVVVDGPQFVAAPGGRMLATWTDFSQNDAGYSEPDLYATVREPGQAFGPVKTLLSRTVASGQSADILGLRAAAGPDGTLALVAQTEDCPNTDANTVATSVASVWVSPPGGKAGLNGTQLAHTTSTATHVSRVTALAAGDGEALVGIHDTDVTKDPAGDTVLGYCGQPADSGRVSGTYTDEARLTGAGDHILGTGDWETTNVPRSGGGVNNVSNDVSIDNASLDANGYATVLGSLDTTDAVQYAAYGPAGNISTPPTGTPTSPASTSTASTSTPVTTTATTYPVAAASPGSTSPLPQTAERPLPQKVATIHTAASGGVGSAGVQTVTVTNTTTGVENLTIAEYAYASGLTTAAPHLVIGKAPKLALVSSTRVRLLPHHALRIRLKLTSAATHALRLRHHLNVTLKLTSTERGHATKTTLKHLTLRLA